MCRRLSSNDKTRVEHRDNVGREGAFEDWLAGSLKETFCVASSSPPKLYFGSGSMMI